MPRRFDIMENTRRRDLYPFLIILQHDRVSSTDSVVVAPLVHVKKGPKAGHLHPIVEVDGDQYVILTEDLASTSRGQLGPIRGSAESKHYEITRALDMLFTGV